MNTRDVIALSLKSTQDLLGSFLKDLGDADLLVRPAPSANHIAWQLGHLIDAEIGMGSVLPGAKYEPLPAGWKEQYTKETAAKEPPMGFATKAEYLRLFNQARAATIAAAAKLTEADLDKPTTPDMASWAPTIGSLLMLFGTHTMMHVGQFTVVRRKLGKPVLF